MTISTRKRGWGRVQWWWMSRGISRMSSARPRTVYVTWSAWISWRRPACVWVMAQATAGFGCGVSRWWRWGVCHGIRWRVWRCLGLRIRWCFNRCRTRIVWLARYVCGSMVVIKLITTTRRMFFSAVAPTRSVTLRFGGVAWSLVARGVSRRCVAGVVTVFSAIFSRDCVNPINSNSSNSGSTSTFSSAYLVPSTANIMTCITVEITQQWGI